MCGGRAYWAPGGNGSGPSGLPQRSHPSAHAANLPYLLGTAEQKQPPARPTG